MDEDFNEFIKGRAPADSDLSVQGWKKLSRR